MLDMVSNSLFLLNARRILFVEKKELFSKCVQKNPSEMNSVLNPNVFGLEHNMTLFVPVPCLCSEEMGLLFLLQH